MRASIVVVCLLASAAAFALDPPEAPIQNPLATSGDFLFYHPDQSYRMDAMKAYGHGNYEFALRDFRVAARYADKPSQAMLASMYWDGRGVARDRALAYAWMDLAAERGYPWLLASRERYWEAMSDSERKRAIEVGQPLYAEFGDAAAQPRLSVWLRRGRVQATGSHTGFIGYVDIQQAVDGFGYAPAFDGNDYYAPRYWQDKDYWGWQASTWNPKPTGKVDVSPLQSVNPASVVAPGSPQGSPPPEPLPAPASH